MANVKQVKIGSTTYDVEALHFITGTLDTPAQWKQYIDDIGAAASKIQIVVDEKSASAEEPATTASASTTGKIYLVAISGQESGNYTEFVTVESGTTTKTYAWEKIGTTATDLSEYLKKGATYTAAALSAGGHTHTVTVPTISVDTTKKLSASASGTTVGANGTATAVTSYPGATSKLVTTTVTGVSGSTTASKATAGTAVTAVSGVTISSEDATATGRVSYIASVSAPTLGGTTTFNTNAIKDVALSASTTSTDGPAYLSAASGTFVTSAIKNVILTSSDSTSEGAVTYVSGVSGSAPSLTGTKTFVTGYGSFSGGSFTQGAKASWSASVSNGVLSFSWSANGTDTFSAASLGTASTGTVGISGGSYSATTKYLTGSGEAAATGSVSTTTRYMKRTLTNAGTGTVSISGGSGTTKYLAVTAPTNSITPYTFTDVTVPKAATSATTVATGALNANGGGSSVMTGLGTAATATVLTGVKVTAQPSITISESTTATGPVNEHITVGTNSATTSSDGAHTHDVKVNS